MILSLFHQCGWSLKKKFWRISQIRIVSKVYVVFFYVFELRFRLRFFYFNLNLKKLRRGFSVGLADSCYTIPSGEKHSHKLIVTVSPDRLTLSTFVSLLRTQLYCMQSRLHNRQLPFLRVCCFAANDFGHGKVIVLCLGFKQ